MALQSRVSFGVGFKFKTDAERCHERVCLITAWHLVKPRGEAKTEDGRSLGPIGGQINDGFRYPDLGRLRLASLFAESDADLDLAVVRLHSHPLRLDGAALEPIDERVLAHIKSLREWEFAPRGSVEVGIPARVVTYDYIPVSPDGNEGLVLPTVLSGHVSHYESGSDTFLLYVETIEGNSGGVVLNERMQVIGMVLGAYSYIDRFTGVREDIPQRAVAVHVDAIRDKLCDWEYLTGSDCR